MAATAPRYIHRVGSLKHVTYGRTNTCAGTQVLELTPGCPVRRLALMMVARPSTHVPAALARVVPRLDLCVQQLQRCSVIDITRRTLVSTRRQGGTLVHREETHWVLSSYRSYITREDDYSPGTPTGRM